MILRILLILFMITVPCTHAISDERLSSQVRLVMTSQPKEIIPESKFGCEGRIYAYLTFPSTFVGHHKLDGSWVKPNGEEQEHTALNLTFEPHGGRTAYMWYEFKRRSFFDGIKFGNYGNHSSDLSGVWNLKMNVDGNVLTQSTFTVSCLDQ